jgi:transposase
MLAFRERNEGLRSAFSKRIGRISAKNLVYVDETGIEQCLYREFARSPRGQKVVGFINGKKFKRTNIVAGLCQKSWVAPFQYDGYTDSGLFEFWFENCLLKEITRKFIVLDNATFHRKTRLMELAERKKCKVIFLPPYSPDLNPIENKWAWVKRKLRGILSDCSSLDDALWGVFKVE